MMPNQLRPKPRWRHPCASKMPRFVGLRSGGVTMRSSGGVAAIYGIYGIHAIYLWYNYMVYGIYGKDPCMEYMVYGKYIVWYIWYMVTWIPSIYPLYVSIYTSTMDPNWATQLGDICWANVGKLISSTMGRIWEKFCGTFWGNQTAKNRREFTMGFKHQEWAEWTLNQVL